MDLNFEELDKLIMDKHPCRNCKYAARRKDGVLYYDPYLAMNKTIGIFCKNMEFRKKKLGNRNTILDYVTFDTRVEDLKNEEYAECEGFCEK